MGVLVYPQPMPVDELAPEPCGAKSEYDAHERKKERQPVRRVGGCTTSTEPADDEQDDDHGIPAAVPKADPLRARASGSPASR